MSSSVFFSFSNNVTYYYYSAFNLSVNKPPGLNEIVPQDMETTVLFLFPCFPLYSDAEPFMLELVVVLVLKTEEYV